MSIVLRREYESRVARERSSESYSSVYVNVRQESRVSLRAERRKFGKERVSEVTKRPVKVARTFVCFG